MTVGYVAVYEECGNSTPTAPPTATGTVKGVNSLCLANQNALNTEGNPIGVSTCNGGAAQQWSSYSDSTLRVQGGCLDVVSAGWHAGPETSPAPAATSAYTGPPAPPSTATRSGSSRCPAASPPARGRGPLRGLW
jgi:hypothetical protein